MNSENESRAAQIQYVLTDEKKEKRKARKTRIGISFFVLLLAVGVMGNWYIQNNGLSSQVSPISAAKEKILGEAKYVDATTEPVSESEYFSDARLERQKARDESAEKLQSVIDSAEENEDIKKQAGEAMAKLSNIINAENKIETLVCAKGINSCIAVSNEDGSKVDIIVDSEELTENQILQIKEIAVSQLGCTYENVTIIQSN